MYKHLEDFRLLSGKQNGFILKVKPQLKGLLFSDLLYREMMLQVYCRNASNMPAHKILARKIVTRLDPKDDF